MTLDGELWPFAFVNSISIGNGISVQMRDESIYTPWFNDNRYAKNYPLSLIIKVQSGSSATLTQVMQFVFEVDVQCSQNEVTTILAAE